MVAGQVQSSQEREKPDSPVETSQEIETPAPANSHSSTTIKQKESPPMSSTESSSSSGFWMKVVVALLIIIVAFAYIRSLAKNPNVAPVTPIAAFFIVLTLLTKNSELLIRNVLLNDTRAGVLKILERMGAVIEKSHVEELDGEMRGDLLVRSSELENVKIEADVIPNIIDEIPILSVAGLFAKGKFVIRGAQELRKKESDRIKSLCENYAKIGVEVNEFDDGFELIGEPKVKYGEFESFGDHRIAMTFAVLSMLLEEGGVVEDFECVEISNPAFIEQIQKISVA
jgi:3-phosphoshikimate 1-carboxyvinyltransferase